MEPTRSKRRRLMPSSYVSLRPRSDLPARFESLNDDTLTTALEFVGGKSYRSFGGINKHCKEIYLTTPGMTKETFLYGYAPLVVISDRIERAIDWELYERVGKGIVLYGRKDLLDWALQEENIYLLRQICFVAGREGRIDVLEELWNYIEDDDDKRYVFQDVDECVAGGGRLNVLKWLETIGLGIHKEACASQAARYSQLHILQWLREERGFEFNPLSGLLYNDAIEYGGHMRILKWLREQGCPWYEYTFSNAAREGNLDVLQWLHDEGCPWPEDHFVYDSLLKPEALDWCRVKGYGDRII